MTIVRSMPVATVVVATAMLFVSSASKIALLGSTVAVFVMVPSVGGATRTISIVSDAPARRVGIVQVTMPAGFSSHRALEAASS